MAQFEFSLCVMFFLFLRDEGYIRFRHHFSFFHEDDRSTWARSSRRFAQGNVILRLCVFIKRDNNGKIQHQCFNTRLRTKIETNAVER